MWLCDDISSEDPQSPGKVANSLSSVIFIAAFGQLPDFVAAVINICSHQPEGRKLPEILFAAASRDTLQPPGMQPPVTRPLPMKVANQVFMKKLRIH